MPVEFSKLTSKAQTTVPKTVRQVLGIGAGDRLEYEIEDGRVSVRRAGDQRDPEIAAFLELIARDIATAPDHIQHLDDSLLAQARALTEGIDVDLDEEIEGDVGL